MRITDLPTLGDSPLAEDSPALASAGITRGIYWWASTGHRPQPPAIPPVHDSILGCTMQMRALAEALPAGADARFVW